MSIFIIAEIGRVCRGYILNLESEGSYKAFPRDFQKMFERIGFEMISSRFLVWDNNKLDYPRRVKYADILQNNTVRLYVPLE